MRIVVVAMLAAAFVCVLPPRTLGVLPVCPLGANPAVTYELGWWSSLNIEVADFDVDGHADFCMGAQNIIGVALSNAAVIRYGTPEHPPTGAPFTVWSHSHTGEAFVAGAGDIDGDGIKDFVGSSNNNLYWWRATGVTGAPLAPAITSIGTFIAGYGATRWTAEVGDLDLDGDGDVVHTSYGNGVQLSMNTDGAGTAWATTTIHGTGTGNAALVDLNGDGHLDVLFAQSFVYYCYFVPPSTCTPVSTGISAAGARFMAVTTHNDGFPDSPRLLAVTQGSSANVLIRQTAGGTWVGETLPYSGRNAVFGDLDGDAHPELVATAGSTLAFVVQPYPRRSPPLFPYASIIAPVTENFKVVVADFDHNNYPDMIYVDRYSANNVKVYMGGPMPDFGIPTTTTLAPDATRLVAAADANSDGALDVLAHHPAVAGGSIVLYVNSGSGAFSSTPLASSLPDLSGLAFVDANLDAALDVVYAEAGSDKVMVLVALPALAYAAPAVLAASPSATPVLAFLFLNADGNELVDLALGTQAGLELLVSSAPLVFAPAASSPLFTGAPVAALASGDVFDDGYAELAFAASAPSPSVFLCANPAGVLLPPTSVASGEPVLPTSLSFAHINGPNSTLDVVWLLANTSTARWHDVAGSTTASIALATPAATVLAAVDFQRDGLAHLVVGSDTNATQSWMTNTANQGFTQLHPSLALHVASGLRAHALRGVDLSGSGWFSLLVGGADGLVLVGPQSHVTTTPRASAVGLHLDHPECGGVRGTVACLSAALARVSPCLPGPVTLNIPASVTRFVGCPTTRGPVLIRGTVRLRFPPHSVVDCAAYGGGALFASASPPGHSLFFDSMSVRGTTDSAVVSTVASLFFTSCSFTACSSPSTGAAVRATAVERVHITSSTFAHNTAASGGGLAITGTATTVALVDVVFAHNTALGGNGGGASIIVTAGATLDNATFADNSAAGTGGGLALVATASVAASTLVFENNAAHIGGGLALLASNTHTLSVADARVAGNSAVFGGTFAVASDIPLPADHGRHFPAASAVIIPGRIVLGGASEVGASTADSGGLAFLCNGELDASAATATGGASARLAGGAVFLCVGSPAFVATATLPPGYASSVDASGYGAVVATPPMLIAWTHPPTAVVTSPTGIVAALPSTLEVRDEYGAAIGDPDLVLSLTALSSGFALGSGATIVVPDLATRTYVAPFVSLVAATEASLNSPVSVAFGIVSEVSIVPVHISFSLTACPPGFGLGSGPGAPLECEACAPGSFSTNTSILPCELEKVCAAPAVSFAGACHTCPANTLRVANGSGSGQPRLEPCVCDRGFYSPSRTRDTACEACPSGASCAGGVASPIALAEWYPTTPGAARPAFSLCPIRGACLVDVECAREYAVGSYMCKDCADGYFRRNDGTCDVCPDAAVAFFVLVFVLIVVVAGVAAVVVVLAGKAMMKEEARVRTPGEARSKLVPHSVSVGLVFLQVLGILARAPFNWPQPPIQQVLDTANLSNLDLTLFSTDCTVTSFAMQYTLPLAVPLLLLVCVVALVAGYAALSRAAHPPIGAMLQRLLFTFGPLLYIPLSRATLIFFDCTQLPNGRWYLDAELSQECYVGSWFSLFVVALPALALYVVALPTVFAAKLWRARHKLHEAHTLLRLGPLYNIYLREYYYFEVLLLLKRLGIVCSALFFSNIPVWLFGGLITVFVTFTFAQLKYEPFYDPMHNSLETRLNLSILVLIICGIFFWADSFPNPASFAIFVCIAVGSLSVGIGTIVAFGIRESLTRTPSSVGPDSSSVAIPITSHDVALASHVRRHLADVSQPVIRSLFADAVGGASVSEPRSLLLDACSATASSSASTDGSGSSKDSCLVASESSAEDGARAVSPTELPVRRSSRYNVGKRPLARARRSTDHR